MQFQEQTLILKNPDGSIQIAVQPHIKGKKQIECYQCKSILIYEGTPQVVKCSSCQTHNGIPGSQSQKKQVECANCGRRNDIINMDGTMLSICVTCNTITGIL